MKDRAYLNEVAIVGDEEVKKARDKCTRLRLDYTIISIITTGGSIDISLGSLFHIVNKLKKKDSDFHTYIAVSDFVDYIDYMLNSLDVGCVDFEDKGILSDFEDFCTDRVNSRKSFIAKSIELRGQSTVKLSDYLIYYVNNDGNYIQIKNNEGNTDGKEN